MKALYYLLVATLAVSLTGCFKADVNVKAPKNFQVGNWLAPPVEAADQGIIFTGYDSLALEGKPVVLAARITDYQTARSLAGITVGFYLGSKQLGIARTDSRGLAKMDWLAPRVGSLLLNARIQQVPDSMSADMLKARPVPIRIEAIDIDTPIALIDVADTLLDGSSKGVIRGDRPAGGAAATINAIARDHTIVYQADRNELLTVRAKNWFADQGFPTGVILQIDHKFEFDDVRRLKTADAHNIRQTFKKVALGVTGRRRVAEDFLQEDLRTFLIVYVDNDADDLRDQAEDIRKMAGLRKLNAVDNWRDLEKGIDQNRSYPAADLAKTFETRAHEMDKDD